MTKEQAWEQEVDLSRFTIMNFAKAYKECNSATLLEEYAQELVVVRLLYGMDAERECEMFRALKMRWARQYVRER